MFLLVIFNFVRTLKEMQQIAEKMTGKQYLMKKQSIKQTTKKMNTGWVKIKHNLHKFNLPAQNKILYFCFLL